MSDVISGFDWDAGNWPKCSKHGVSRAEIEALFSGECAIYPDPAHSRTERRSLAIGNVGNRFVLVAFTFRRLGAKTLIRPISARYMHQKEVEHYERQRQS
jgi:uncharacterized protein